MNYFSKARTDSLLAAIRDGQAMAASDKLNLIFQLSLPSILAQVTNVMMFFIDQAMVGSLGAEAPAAIGLVESTIWLFGGLASAVSMGFSVQAAHFIGANDFEKARDVVRHGLHFCLAFSLVAMLSAVLLSRPLPVWLGGGSDIVGDAATYFLIFACAIPFMQLNNLSAAILKCEGNMRVSSTMSVILCVLDVIFNFLFIFPTREVTLHLPFSIFNFSSFIFHLPGLGLGVAGAALGTAVAYFLCSLTQAWLAFFRSRILSVFRLSKYGVPYVTSKTFHSAYITNALKISMPMAAQSALMSGAQIVSTMIVAPLGNFAIAANTFAITAESLCYMPGYGIGEAATTLVGQSVGARRADLCKSFAWMAVCCGMVVMALMGVVMYLSAYDMMSLMTPVSEIRVLGSQVLRIEAFAEPFFAASIVVYCICVGAGDTLRPSAINLGSMWLVRLTLAALLARDYGLRGVWLAMAVELTFRGTLFLIHLFRGRWMKTVSSHQ